jgi:opacity protein-like surface antigen
MSGWPKATPRELSPLLIGAVAALVGWAFPCAADWTAAAYIGAVHTRPAVVMITQPAELTTLTFPGVRFRSESFDSPLYYGYRIGRSVPGTRTLFIEAEFIHAKAFAESQTAAAGSGTRDGAAVRAVAFGDLIRRLAMSHGMNFILLNAAVRYPLGGRLGLTGRAGAGPMLPHGETQVRGVQRDGYEWGGLGIQAAVGVEVRVWQRALAIVEYKLTRADTEISIDKGKASCVASSHHLTFGVGLTF